MVELRNINKIYTPNKNDKIVALKNINLKFEENKLIVLKGASGSGKSTILSLIAALSKPTSGEVIVDNQIISKLPDRFSSIYRQKNIGFVFQKYKLIPNLDVFDNIVLPLIPTNPNKAVLNNMVDDVLRKFNILDKKNILVKMLSGGEQQRVAIARAIINDPKIIIADEPTANLDLKLSLEFIDIIKNLKDSGATIIIATHDPLFFELDFIDEIITMSNLIS